MTDFQMISHNIMDVHVHAVTMEEAVRNCILMAEDANFHMIATANAEMLMIAGRDSMLCSILNQADMVVPDGAGVLWAGEKLHCPFPERVPGIDLMGNLLQEASAREWPVYFLGGAPGVAREAADRFEKTKGPLVIAGIHDGYFTAEEERDILDQIRENGSRLLFVGMGVPKQEKWISLHASEIGPCVAMGIGGTFDVMAGRLKRAPAWMRNHRMEWAYRLYLQPSRIGRMLALPLFMNAVRRWKSQQT